MDTDVGDSEEVLVLFLLAFTPIRRPRIPYTSRVLLKETILLER